MNDTTDSAQRLGKWMFYLTWILALALGSYFFQNWIDQKRNPNQHLSSVEGEQVVLRQNSRGHYVANGYINDLAVTFLLDTGATDISIPKAIAEQLQLQTLGTNHANTANGVIEVFPTRLDQVALGGLKIRRVEAHINPYMQGDTVLLGMSFLRQLSLTQRDGTLTLSAP